MGQRMVLRWAEEQWAGAVPRLKAALEALEKLKKEAESAAIKEKDTRFTLEVGAWLSLAHRVLELGVWALTGPTRRAFLHATCVADKACHTCPGLACNHTTPCPSSIG